MKKFIYVLTVLVFVFGMFCIFASASHAAPVFEDYYSHESRPHIPRPSSQADVAAGIGLSTVGIFVVNSFTKTSVFGSTSFNTSFNPANPPASPAVQAPSASVSSSGGGFFNSVGGFFKSLFETLKEMLTDEGRSYASGRLSEIIEKTDFTSSE